MQSSRMNALKLPFSAAIHSPRRSRSGELGVRPTRARPCSVAVDKAEAPDLGLRVAFASPPEDQSRGRADPSCQKKPDAECADGCRHQVGAQLPAHVGDLFETVAQRLRSAGQLLTLVLDVAPDVGDAARVATGHCSSMPRSSASPLESPAPEPAVCLS